jgi:hypothetical protein
MLDCNVLLDSGRELLRYLGSVFDKSNGSSETWLGHLAVSTRLGESVYSSIVRQA